MMDPRPTSPTVRRPYCRRCARLRWFAAGTIAALAGLLIHASAQAPAASDAGPLSAPARLASAPLSTPLAARAAPAAAASSSPLMWLTYKTVALPSARLQQPYKAREVVRGGHAPYRFTVDGGKLPAGMFFEDEGLLAGTPTEAGSFSFLLTVEDASAPGFVAQQSYTLRVTDPKASPSPAVAAPRTPPVPPAPKAPAAQRDLSRDDADRHFGRDPALPMTWKLTAADLEQLIQPAPAAVAAAPAEAPVTEPTDPAAPVVLEAPVDGPTTDQLKEMLAPLIDVEFPVREVMARALLSQRCAYYLQHVTRVALKEGTVPPKSCPEAGSEQALAEAQATMPVRGKAAAGSRKPAAAPATDRMLLTRFLDLLMPDALREDILHAAEKSHPLTGVQPLSLAGDGCGCASPESANEVVGFLPYWLTGADAKTPIPVRFDLFNRLQYMGVILGDDGEFLKPPGWDSRGGGFAREARRHGVRLDLVLYKRDWPGLLSQPESRWGALIEKAVKQAVQLADVREPGLQGRLDDLLLPVWQESAYVYDGLTVFFDGPAADGPDGADAARFERFLMRFMHALTVEMQSTGRDYHLHLVVPHHQMGDTGAFRFSNLYQVLTQAESPTIRKGTAGNAYKVESEYKGSTDITVDFLVLMGSAGDRSKMDLRLAVDNSTALPGKARMAILESIAPILIHERGDKLLPPTDRAEKEIDQELVYIGWAFGGVGFWPIPTPDLGQGAGVLDSLYKNFWGYGEDPPYAFCGFVCEHRMMLRLLFQALVLCEAAGLLVYAWNCRVRRLGWRYLAGLWIFGLTMLALALALFSCDPVLHRMREENYLLYGLIAVLLIGGLIVTFKPRVEEP